MKIKFVFWGVNVQDECVLIVFELLVEENKVKIMIFFELVVIEEFSQKMMQEWCNGIFMEMFEDCIEEICELMVIEGFLLDELKVERGDLIQCVQMEWYFVVFFLKLN